MPDNVIQVEITAAIAGLQEGMEQAREMVQGATAGMADAMTGAAEAGGEASDAISSSVGEAAASVGESLTAMKEQFATMAESVQASAFDVGSAMSGLGALMGVGFAGEFLHQMQDTEIELAHLSDATGVAVSSLVEMRGSMQQSGVNTTRFSDTMARLSEHLLMAREGSKEEVEAFRALGISQQDLASKSFTVQDALMRIADYMHRTGGSAQALGSGYLLLGRQAVELMGWLRQGSAAIKDQMDGLRGLGDQAQKSAESALQLKQAEAQLSQQLDEAVLPAFRGIVDVVTLLDEGFIYAKLGFGVLVNDIAAGVTGAILSVEKLGSVVKDALTLNFRKAALDARGAANGISAAMQVAASEDVAEAQRAIAQIAALNATPESLHEEAGGNLPTMAPRIIHAPRPHHGKSPADAMAESIQRMESRMQAAMARSASLRTNWLASYADATGAAEKRQVEAMERGNRVELQFFRERERREQEIRLRIEHEKQKLAEEEERRARRVANVIDRSFQQSMSGVMRGTENLHMAVLRLGESIEASIGGALERVAIQWVTTHLLMRQVSAETAQKDVAHSAAMAAGKAYSAEAGIPIIGPELGAAAAAATFAGVMAFSSIASAAGGQWQVPGNQLTMLHANEMVLPAQYAEPMRRTVEGSGAGGARHVHFHVGAVDGADLEDVLTRNEGAVHNVARRAFRARGM